MASHATGDGNIPSRDAKKKGLKRIMTVGGAYGTRNYTVKDLRDLKGKRILTETVPFSIEEAIAAEEAGIDTMKVRFDPNNPDLAISIRRAAPNTFMAFSVPLIAAASEDEAVRIAYKAMEIGADAVMCQWSPRFIAAATEAGVPVQGHAGLVPRRSTWTGGLKAVGKTIDEAIWVYNKIKEFEDRRCDFCMAKTKHEVIVMPKIVTRKRRWLFKCTACKHERWLQPYRTVAESLY